MSLTNDQLLALIVDLQETVSTLTPGEGGDITIVGGEYDDMVASATSLMLDYLRTNTLYADYIAGQTITADNAWVKFLECNDLITKSIRAEVANIDTLNATEVNALIGNYLTLNADDLFAEFIKADEAVVGTLTTKQLMSRMGEFLTLITDTLTATGVQAFKIDGSHVNINSAQITDAMIQNISASKLTSGVIRTDNVTLQDKSSESTSNMLIKGSVIQISDGTYVRVLMGYNEDEGDYDLEVWDADGNCMWSALGITADAIKDSIIVDDMIADDANISADKINIESLITKIEDDGGITTNASKIIVDADNQNLSTWFSTINTWKQGQSESTTQLETSVQALQGSLSSYVSQTTFDSYKGQIEADKAVTDSALQQLQDALDAMDLPDISGLEDDIAALGRKIDVNVTPNITNLTTKVNNITQLVQEHSGAIEDIEGGFATISSNYTTMSQTMDSISASLSTQTATVEAMQQDITDLETSVEGLPSQSEISTLQTTVESYSTDIQAHSDFISTIQNKTLLTQNDVDTQLAQFQSEFTSRADAIEANFTNNVLAATNDKYVSQSAYNQWFKADAQGLHIGSSTSPVTLHLSNTGIVFKDASNNEIGYWDGSFLHCHNIKVDTTYRAQFGKFAWIPNSDGSLVLRKVED